jgi:serine/threonine protein kinase
MNIINEKRILEIVDSPFIVKLRFSFQDKNKIIMGFDYHNGGELFYLLQKRKRLSEEEVKFFGTEMFLALKYLHSKLILYRDIKPENIIIDRNGHIKVIDFGLAKKLVYKKMFTKTFCGTNEYIRKFIFMIYI